MNTVGQKTIASMERLKETLLPDDWYVDPCGSHENFSHLGDWWCVVTADSGVMAAFPSHYLAYAWAITAYYGNGGRAA